MQCSDLCKKTAVMTVLEEVNERNTCGGVCVCVWRRPPILPPLCWPPSLSATAGRGSSNGKHCDVVVLYECSTPSTMSECLPARAMNDPLDKLSMENLNMSSVEITFWW